jgi:hypothetical protein
MASILFTGGLSLAIGTRGGGEWVWPGETGTKITGEKGNHREFGEQSSGLKGTKVSLSSVVVVIGGGVVKLGVGKYSEVIGLKQGTT